MYTKEDIQSVIEECLHMWESEKHDYALVRVHNGFMILYKPTQESEVIESDEAWHQITANMLEAGVEVLDRFPGEVD